MTRPIVGLAIMLIATTFAQAQTSTIPPQAPTRSATLTLPQAIAWGMQNNVQLIAARAEVGAFGGRLDDSRGLLWNNPEISGERTRRRTPQTGTDPLVTREWTAGLSQTFEIAGQQGYRREAARQDLAGAEYRLAEAERQLKAEIERRFVRVLALQAQIAVAGEGASLIGKTAAFVQKRLAAGEDSKLDANVAMVEASRAQSQLASLEDQLLEARLALGELLQWPQGLLPETEGDLAPSPLTGTLDDRLGAVLNRPRLQALQAQESAARNRLSLERAARMPDITVGLTQSREGPAEFREKVTGLTVTIPLPLFKRNAGNVAQAQAELDRAQGERRAGERDLPALIRGLWTKAENLAQRVTRLREQVLPALQENQRLSQQALHEGEISLSQLVLVNRQMLDGQRELIETTTDWRLARIALDEASGERR